MELIELKNLFGNVKKYEQIRDEIMSACALKGNRISRTTWSNWMNGKSQPNNLQSQIITNILEKYHD